jgi:hypothetical protein
VRQLGDYPKRFEGANNIRTNSVAFEDFQSADLIKGIVCLSEIKKDQVKGMMFDMGILHAQYKFKDGSASASGRSKTMERIMERDAGFVPRMLWTRTPCSRNRLAYLPMNGKTVADYLVQH